MKFGQRAYEYYKDLPTWAKGVIVVGGAAVTWFAIGAPLVKAIKKKLSVGNKVREGKEAQQELATLAKQGIKPTISDAQAESFANALRIAFSGCGTDEAAIYRVIASLNNDADVYKLISTYGVREYVDCPWWSVGFGSGKTQQTLSGAISDELNSMEKAMLNSILEKKKIKFRFA